MKITLAQAVPLKSSISRRIQDLLQERKRAAFVEVEKGEKYEKPQRTMEVITEELNQARKDYLDLDESVARENLNAKIDWDGAELSIVKAIELAKQKRGEAAEHKSFGDKKKQEKKQSGGWGNTDSNLWTYALYEPETYRTSALKLQREADRLSLEIERKNHFVEFDFAAAERYL